MGSVGLPCLNKQHHPFMNAPSRPPSTWLIVSAVVCILIALVTGYCVGRNRSATAAPLHITFSDAAPSPSPAPAHTATSSAVPIAEPAPQSTAAIPSMAYAFCAACHRPDGVGISGIFPSLVGSARLLGDERQAIAIVIHGFSSQGDPHAPRWSGRMAPLAQLDDQHIADAINYARQSWGNKASIISPDRVREIRAQYSSRSLPWTPNELNLTFPPLP